MVEFLHNNEKLRQWEKLDGQYTVDDGSVIRVRYAIKDQIEISTREEG